MQTTLERIKVMNAFVDGRRIECRQRSRVEWVYTCNPVWNWEVVEYRVEQGKKKLLAYIDTNGELRQILSTSALSHASASWSRMPQLDVELCS
jgi:hypothetical protein